MQTIVDLTEASGRITINMKAIRVGNDLCVIIAGGERPHIGCVTLSQPRPSLADERELSATTSVLNILGHKDDEVAKYVSHTLAAKLNKNVAVTGGIHVDNITPAEIKIIFNLLQRLTNNLIHQLI